MDSWLGEYLGWIIAGAIIGVFVLIVLGIIVWSKTKRHQLYEELLEADIIPGHS